MATPIKSIVAPFILDFGKATDPKQVIEETSLSDNSTHPYLYVTSGGQMIIEKGRGNTIQGDVLSGKWHDTYKATPRPQDTDGGLHPQNLFRLYTRQSDFLNNSCSAVFKINKDNLADSSERKESNGIFIFGRASTDGMNGYYAGLRVDGTFVIKRKRNKLYTPLMQFRVFPGTYNRDNNPNLLPHSSWIGIKLDMKNLLNGNVALTFYTDLLWTGTWKQLAYYEDTNPIRTPGHLSLRTDFMDCTFDQLTIN